MLFSNENLWQTNEFAKRAKVSVRTLQYYDRIGLLKPKRNLSNGFRLYGDAEFAKLQHILTLKFLGFSLSKIKEILGQKEFDLVQILQMQRKIIESQHRRLGQVLQAIGKAEEVFRQENSIDWNSFEKINEVINMEQNWEKMKQYYSEDAQAKIEERRKLWNPELQEQVTKDWNELIQSVDVARKNGVSPASEEAQKLAARWRELVGQFTGGDAGIMQGLNKMYADDSLWQGGDFKKPFSDEVFSYIKEAMNCNA